MMQSKLVKNLTGRAVLLNAEASRWCKSLLLLVFILPTCGVHGWAQRIHYAARPDVKNGEAIYKDGCIACHGSDGKGAPQVVTMFKRPDTFPDFTDCSGTTPEPDGTWTAVIVQGRK